MRGSLLAGFAAAVMAGSAAAASPPPAPPVPDFTACRTAAKLVVEYRFKTFPTTGPRRPSTLLVSAKSAGNRYPPLTFRTEKPKRSARLTQPLGLGAAPWRVLLSVRGAGGGRSLTISRPLLPCR